jgi:hypothetical protein
MYVDESTKKKEQVLGACSGPLARQRGNQRPIFINKRQEIIIS